MLDSGQAFSIDTRTVVFKEKQACQMPSHCSLLNYHYYLIIHNTPWFLVAKAKHYIVVQVICLLCSMLHCRAVLLECKTYCCPSVKLKICSIISALIQRTHRTRIHWLSMERFAVTSCDDTLTKLRKLLLHYLCKNPPTAESACPISMPNLMANNTEKPPLPSCQSRLQESEPLF